MAENKIKRTKSAADKFWTLKRKESMNGYLFILPWIIGTALLFAFPIWRSLEISFSNITDITTYEMEMVHKFIAGVEPLENFDIYLENLKKAVN